MHNAVLIMAKRPAPGRTKTRLTPPFTPQQAADLYACFLHDMVEIARTVPNTDRFIAYAPIEEAAYFEQLAPDFGRVFQDGDDLGARLDHVMTTCFNQGYQQVIATNSDGPTLPAAYIADAFTHLERGDVDAVFGPCEDGGYYLIGLREPQPRLTRDVEMSTPSVLADTLALAAEMGLRVALLPEWYDVDTVDELARLRVEIASSTAQVAVHTRRFLAAANRLIS